MILLILPWQKRQTCVYLHFINTKKYSTWKISRIQKKIRKENEKENYCSLLQNNSTWFRSDLITRTSISIRWSSYRIITNILISCNFYWRCSCRWISSIYIKLVVDREVNFLESSDRQTEHVGRNEFPELIDSYNFVTGASSLYMMPIFSWDMTAIPSHQSHPNQLLKSCSWLTTVQIVTE